MCNVSWGRDSQSSTSNNLAINDSWCTETQNYPLFKKMVNNYKLQKSCQWLTEHDCSLIAGTTAVAATVAAHRARKTFLDTQRKPLISCQTATYLKNNKYFNVFFKFIGWNIANAASNLCQLDPSTRHKMNFMASRMANDLIPDLEQATKVYNEHDIKLKQAQERIVAELNNIEKKFPNLDMTTANRSVDRMGLGKIQEMLDRESGSARGGWNPYLKEKAARLREEFLQAKSNPQKINMAAIEIREFIVTNFPEDELERVGGMSWREEFKELQKSSNKHLELLDNLERNSVDKNKSISELETWCIRNEKKCNSELKSQIKSYKQTSQDIIQSSRKANVLKIRHAHLSSVVEDIRRLGPRLSVEQARELLMRLSENVDQKYFIFNDFKQVASSLGQDVGKLKSLGNVASGLRGSQLKQLNGTAVNTQELNELFSKNNYRNLLGLGLGKVGQKSASIAVLGLTSVKSVLAAPAKALEFIVTPGNNFDPEQCQHDIITSPYVNLDESCSPTTDFTEGIDALLDSSVDEIIQHCKDYPVVCDVLKKNLPLTGPQRWQIKKCNKNDIGELIGYEAEQRDKRDVKLNWSVTSEAPGGAMTVYSLSKTSSSNIPNSAWKALLGESGEPIKIRLSKTPIMSMKRKRYQALALNDSKLYYQLDPNKLLEEGSSIFDWNKLKEGSRAYKAALATTQMRLNKLSHTNLKSCCLNYTDECKDYGFVSPGNSNSIRENKSNKKVQ